MNDFERGRQPMETSIEMLQRAEIASQSTPLKATDGYEVFALPEGFMDHFVLVLWKEGQDFPADRRPEGFEMPVTIGDRRGYLMEQSRAQSLEGSE